MATDTRKSGPPSTGRLYGGLTAEQRQQRQRKAFMDAGLSLFGTLGYRAATMRQLCREAGLTDRYFYKNFQDTESLLVEVYTQSMDRIAAEIADAIATHLATGDAEAAIDAGLGTFFTAFQDPRVARVCWLEVLGVSERVDGVYTGCVERFARLIETFARQAVPDADIPDDELHVMCIGLVGAISHSAMQWLLTGYAAPRQVLVSANRRLIRGALLALQA